MTAKKLHGPYPIADATSTVLGRLQRRAFLLDLIAEDMVKGLPTVGHEVLAVCKDRFREAMDTRDFYQLRRHAWTEILGRRPPGTHRIKPSGGARQSVLTAEEIFILHKRYRDLRVLHDSPTCFTEIVNEAMSDVDGSKMMIDRDARIEQTEGQRPDIVAFPPNSMVGRHSRTFSIQIDGKFITTSKGRRRAWSTRSAAEEEVARICKEATSPPSPEPLALFPDAPQVDPERAAAEGRDPVSNSYPTPLGYTPDFTFTSNPEGGYAEGDVPSEYTKKTEQWGANQVQRAKGTRWRRDSLMEFYFSGKDAETLTRVLPLVLEAIDARRFGLRLEIEKTSDDTIVIVKRKEE